MVLTARSSQLQGGTSGQHSTALQGAPDRRSALPRTLWGLTVGASTEHVLGVGGTLAARPGPGTCCGPALPSVGLAVPGEAPMLWILPSTSLGPRGAERENAELKCRGCPGHPC